VTALLVNAITHFADNIALALTVRRSGCIFFAGDTTRCLHPSRVWWTYQAAFGRLCPKRTRQ